MKPSKNVLIIVSCVSVATVVAMLLLSDRNEEPDEEREQVINRVEVTEEDDIVDGNLHYVIKLTDGAVVLYREQDGISVELERIKIDTTYYPHDDIQELKNGIEVGCEEDGYKILENFAS